ncbi:MAG TPA: SCO family protein [Candidatus Binatia bacterium]
MVITGVLVLAGTCVAEEPAADRLRTVDPADAGYTYGVGVFKPEYTPPPAGTYALPVIDDVSDHPLLDAGGKATRLFALTRDRVAIVAFVYTTCNDIQGCPASFAVLHALDRALAADGDLARRVRLITISFDPERDTPARMAATRRLHQPRSDWRFVTTRGESELAPLLADFDQPVAKLRYEDGAWTGLFRHVLKVFLLDRGHRVRNVYSTGFLHAALVLNDARTLLLEEQPATSRR